MDGGAGGAQRNARMKEQSARPLDSPGPEEGLIGTILRAITGDPLGPRLPSPAEQPLKRSGEAIKAGAALAPSWSCHPLRLAH